MIAGYLNLLYANCNALIKTSNYDFELTGSFFDKQIEDTITNFGFKNEEELKKILLNRPYPEVNQLLQKSPFIKIFYLVNSLSEYNSPKENFDELGRFMYKKSIQHTNNVTGNLVLDLIKDSVAQVSFLGSSFKLNSHKSFIFLSHDIDSLYGSTLQDGLWALKKRRFDVLLRIFVNVITANPHWFNIDLIMNLESEYDYRSTFYWLVNKGKIDARQTNSDYSIKSRKLASTLNGVVKRGFENGLHKSISDDPFIKEINKLPVKVEGNRFHYLKYRLPDCYQEVEDSGLKLDASLGFAEHHGFRNNYGYPFSPYDFKKDNRYSFLEVPLNIMDGTFHRYMKIPVERTAETIISFLEKNKYDSLISLLWHNTFFTDYKYKGYKEEYIKILHYLHEEMYLNINQTQIIEKFSWQAK